MTGAFHLLRTLVNALAFLRQRKSVVQPIEQAKFENHSSRSMRRMTVDVLVRSAVPALRKLKVRATATKTRRSSQEMRSSSAAPMGCSIFAMGCSNNFATGPRTPPLCYLLEGDCYGDSAEMHMFLS